MNWKQIEAFITQHQNEYLDFLYRICSYEARAYDKETLDAMVVYIAEFAKSKGFSVTRKPMVACGDFLTIEINPGATKACLFQAHMDTVHDKGACGNPPVQDTGDRFIGPGVIDCKGGIAIALLTMKALLENGYNRHVRLILTSDEEISNILGGAEEIAFIQEQAKGFPCAINCETAEGDEVVLGRKGIVKYRLQVQGIGGHSGKKYFEAKNAILEAAHKIIALHGESQPGGTTYSCNVIQAGNAPNSIPDSCTITVDIRALTPEAIQIAKDTVERIAGTSYIGDTHCIAELLSIRPPMVRTPETQALFEKILAACHKYDLGSLTPKETGGGSDSCYTQAAGVTSICGFGASGRYQHTNQEYLDKPSVALRAKILSAYLLEEAL